MQFLLLICLMAACLPIDWPAPPDRFDAAVSIAFPGLLTVLQLVVAGLISQITLARLHALPDQRDSAMHRYATARLLFFLGNLTVFAFDLFVLGWGWTARRLGTMEIAEREVLIPCGELIVLAPYLCAQIGSWFFFYDADRALLETSGRGGERFFSRLGYVGFLLRQQLVLVFVPLFLLMAQQGVERVWPQIMRQAWLPIASLLVLPGFLILFPLLLKPLLGLRELPAGPIRARLEANASRLGLRYRKIYLWDTRGGVANAMIVGVIPWLRYIVLTDRLLEDLDDDELDSVFGHEAGHACHGHVLYYGMFLMLSFILLGALAQVVRGVDQPMWQRHRTLFIIAPLIAMGSYMFVAFGFLSRRCERQADVFGCRAGSCANPACQGHDQDTMLCKRGEYLCRTGIAAFIRALKRVEDINGLNRPRHNWREASLVGKIGWIFHLLTGWLHTWQHSTIAKRIAFLRRIAEDPQVEKQFQRRLWRLKWALAIGLLAATLALAIWQGPSILLVQI